LKGVLEKGVDVLGFKREEKIYPGGRKVRKRPSRTTRMISDVKDEADTALKEGKGGKGESARPGGQSLSARGKIAL